MWDLSSLLHIHIDHFIYRKKEEIQKILIHNVSVKQMYDYTEKNVGGISHSKSIQIIAIDCFHKA